MSEVQLAHPDWNRLFEIAAGQQSLFTTQQAAEAGYSPQLLVHYLHTRRAVRLRRGLVTKAELGDVEDALKPFGGLGA